VDEYLPDDLVIKAVKGMLGASTHTSSSLRMITRNSGGYKGRIQASESR
jgi:hypothetical protein